MTKAEISFVRSLSTRQERLRAGLFVCEGVKLVSEALASGLDVKRVYMTASAPSDISGSAAGMAETVSEKEMERISQLKTPSPVLALVGVPLWDITSADPSSGLVLALDDVQDPGNMGTIVRIADWFGITDIICSEATVDCFNPKVVQATMGAVMRVRVHYTALADYLSQSAAGGVPVYGTFLDGSDIYASELTGNGIVVMGNEGQGIGKNAAETVTHRLRIPSFAAPGVSSESLNVAVATAVVCSEFRRR